MITQAAAEDVHHGSTFSVIDKPIIHDIDKISRFVLHVSRYQCALPEERGGIPCVWYLSMWDSKMCFEMKRGKHSFAKLTELIEVTGSAGHGLRVKKIEQTDGGIDGVTAEALINVFI